MYLFHLYIHRDIYTYIIHVLYKSDVSRIICLNIIIMLRNYENSTSLMLITHNSLVKDDIMMRKVKMLWLSGEDIYQQIMIVLPKVISTKT